MQPTDKRSLISASVVVFLLSALVFISLAAMRFTSPTSDEQNHISRGYHYLVTGNLDLNVAPPFVNMLSGIPLLFYKGIIVPSYDMRHSKTYINEFAEDFVWVYNDAETVIHGGRLAIVALSVILGFFVYRWAADMWGRSAGLGALFLYVLDPNVLAHSHLVTTDLGVACMIFLATYSLWCFLRARRARHLILAGMLLGLALASKLSALLMVPVFVALVLFDTIFVWRSKDEPEPSQGFPPTPTRRWRLIRTAAAILFVLAIATVVALWASYGFETERLTSPVHTTVDRYIPNSALRDLAYRVLDCVTLPFPTYFRGIRWLGRYAQRGAPAFLMGQHSEKGWWYYFLVAFAIKTPLPTLILLTGVTLWTLRRRLDLQRREYVLYAAVGAFFAATLFSFLNIGYRHILPALPLVHVIAAKAVTLARGRRDKVVLLALGVWYLVGTARMYPHYLAYFNELVGGPDNGYRYLVDSNLDWGQDLKNLKVYLEREGINEVYLAYFGSAYPSYYSLPALPAPLEKPQDLEMRAPAVYAISATYLQGGYLGDPQAYSWLRSYEPFAKIGYSIFLFRLPAETQDATW